MRADTRTRTLLTKSTLALALAIVLVFTFVCALLMEWAHGALADSSGWVTYQVRWYVSIAGYVISWCFVC